MHLFPHNIYIQKMGKISPSTLTSCSRYFPRVLFLVQLVPTWQHYLSPSSTAAVTHSHMPVSCCPSRHNIFSLPFCCHLGAEGLAIAGAFPIKFRINRCAAKLCSPQRATFALPSGMAHWPWLSAPAEEWPRAVSLRGGLFIMQSILLEKRICELCIREDPCVAFDAF